MGAKIRPKSEKYQKNGIRKFMQKIDAKKVLEGKNLKSVWIILGRSQLPTAIFPHRALEKRKREVKTSFGLCFEWIQKDYNRNCYKMHVKIIIFGPKTFKISSNWHPKSMSKP